MQKQQASKPVHNPRQIHALFKDGLSVTNERLASPLNFNPNMTCYFGLYAEDALFGANFDAYNVKWTGASQVNHEYEAVAMEKAMRWAILSADEATEPVLTTFVLPWWDDKGNSYVRWLSHQTVQAIATVDRINDTGLMIKNSGAPQSGMSISCLLQMKLDCTM